MILLSLAREAPRGRMTWRDETARKIDTEQVEKDRQAWGREQERLRREALHPFGVECSTELIDLIRGEFVPTMCGERASPSSILLKPRGSRQGRWWTPRPTNLIGWKLFAPIKNGNLNPLLAVCDDGQIVIIDTRPVVTSRVAIDRTLSIDNAVSGYEIVELYRGYTSSHSTAYSIVDVLRANAELHVRRVWGMH
ncbi:hypothetical protein FsymDg_4516 [Candidatus Protofrankia datiscae]|uniref:Uncharacterized protein n=2 Tax=Candidatus Protofrankia datiscae TaxID=2716812 RepID=F8AX49_9ACTN|nr:MULTISPECIES: hypothetical protein [Protofrankia]AEH11764.1 hypothetical protein FsymDg_4516 [Candidatus Protofrankia datiscae]